MANEATLAELSALNAKFIHNFVTNDVVSHDAILHRDFAYIGSTGAWRDRASYLSYWAIGFDPTVLVYWDYRDERIALAGDVALVSSVNKWTMRREGKETTGMSFYTDTYVRENGAWKCIRAQITSVAPDNYPPDSTIVRKYVEGRLV